MTAAAAAAEASRRRRQRQRPPTAGEVAALVADYLARGGTITRCPAVYLEPCQGAAPPAEACAVALDPEAGAIAARVLAARPASPGASSPAERAALGLLRKMTGPHAGGVPLEAWRQACQAPDSGITPAGTPNSRCQVANRAIRSLAARRAVAIQGGFAQEAGAATGCAPGLPGVGMVEHAEPAERIAA